MFKVYKQLESGEMSLVSTHSTLALATTAGQAAATTGMCMVQIEMEMNGGDRIVTVIGTPLGG